MPGRSDAGAPLLELSGVTKRFGGGFLRRPAHLALDRVSFTMADAPAAIVAVAGESGSGKTTLARLVLGLLRPTSGRVVYRGRPLESIAGGDRARFRREVQAIFQDPYDACNPFYTVDHVLDVAIRRAGLTTTAREAKRMATEALEEVALAPEATLGRYPHELSGGQLQRLFVARAFLLRPRLIVADEPVSMVDASVRLEILASMARLRDEHGISFLYITHDLSTAAQVSDEILILHRGTVVERGRVSDVIDAPQHEYTRLLIGSIPLPDPDAGWAAREAPTQVDRTAMAIVR